MSLIEGKYRRVSVENHVAFLDALNVSAEMRAAMKQAGQPVFEMTDLGDDRFKAVNKTANRSMEYNFKLGEPFDQKTVDGRECVAAVTRKEPNVLVVVQKPKDGKGKTLVVTRTFTKEGLVVEMDCEGIVSKQFFERF